jgi:hypothetical protein
LLREALSRLRRRHWIETASPVWEWKRLRIRPI